MSPYLHHSFSLFKGIDNNIEPLLPELLLIFLLPDLPLSFESPIHLFFTMAPSPIHTVATNPSTGATASEAFSTTPTSTDPYRYQVGFGNYFNSEADAIPVGYNTPQCCPYKLIPEQLNGTPFVSPRAHLLNIWFYRIRPFNFHRTV